MEPFSVGITLDPRGVRAARIYGKSWQQREAYALLDLVSPLIEQLDALVKGEPLPFEISPKERLQ